MKLHVELSSKLRWVMHLLHGIAAILVVALAGIVVQLAKLSAPVPATERTVNAPRVVDVVTATRADHDIVLTGYATISSNQVLAVSPQVGGRVVAVHPRLEEGEVIPAGEELFRIEDRDYHLQIELNEAQAKRLRADIERLRQDMANTRESLAIRREQLALSSRETERLAELAKTPGLVTATEIDQAAKQVLGDREAIQTLENQLRVLPLQIASLEVEIDRLNATNEIQRLTIARCVATMPFTGRVLSADIEAGQVVAPNMPVATVVDDSKLEISVPLDAREVRDFLHFEDRPSAEAGASGWFAPPTPVKGQVTWVDAVDGQPWACTVARVAAFDRATRTVHLLVTLDPVAADVPAGQRPVSGMFCRVEIPGDVLHDVITLPRSALRANSTVYVVEDDVLTYRSVSVVRDVDAEMIVRGDLQDGDLVITSKLSAPLEGIAVKVRQPLLAGESTAEKSAAPEEEPGS